MAMATAPRRRKQDLLIMTEEGDIYFIPAVQLGQAKRAPRKTIEALRKLLRDNFDGKVVGLATAIYANYGRQDNGNGLLDPTEEIARRRR